MNNSINTQLDISKVVNQYADTVYKVAYSQMKNPTDAEDIFQEVFLRLVRSEPQFESDEHLKAWLIRVTLNCCRSHFKSAWFRHSAPLTEDIPAKASSDNDDNGILEKVLALPPKYRTVIHLFYYEDLSIEDIAKVTKKKVGTVKSLLHRARVLLKDELKGEYTDYATRI